jgi:HEAT repeat protein
MSQRLSGLTLSALERERVQRIDRLTASGERSVPALIRMLDDPSWTVRRAVVAALGTLGPPAVAALCAYLRETRDSEAGIAAAVDALVSSSSPCDEAVAAMAGDTNPAVAADVAQILGRRSSRGQIDTLIALTAHADDNVAVAALEALGRLGGRAAVDALVAAVNSGNFFRTFPALDVLGRSGDPRALGPLTTLLADRRYSLEAARALGRTGDKGAIAPLAKLLASPIDNDVRVAAAALADLHQRYQQRMGTSLPVEEELRRSTAEPTSTRRLSQALASSDPIEQAAICLMLGCLGNEAAVPVLTALLAVDPPIGPAAVDAMKRIGRAAERQIVRALQTSDGRQRAALLPLVHRASSIDEVARCLVDPDPEVRAAACDALARLGDPGAVARLVRLLEDGDMRVVQAASGAIQSLGGPEAYQLVREAAGSPTPAVRRAALRILTYLGHPSALPALLAATNDPDPKVRDTAIYGLPYFEDASALAALLTAVADDSPKIRAAATRALGQCSAEPDVTAALTRALDDRDSWVRYYACQSLGRLRHQAATQPITGLLDDEAGQVRVAAIEALSHFADPAAEQALDRAAHAEDADVRRAALVGLGLGKKPSSLPTLIEAATTGDPATRLVAVSALARFSAPEVIGVLRAAARDSDPTVRSAALGLLAGMPDAGATAVLLEIFCAAPDDDDLIALLAIPSGERAAAIRARLETADDELAPHLVWALARMPERDAAAALIDVLASGNPAARRAAAPTLAELAGSEADRALRRAASADADPEVRRICSLLIDP